MANWPATLPAPALSTLTGSPANNTIRSSMEKGPEKVRRRTTANSKPLAFTLKLTSAQLTILETFYDETTFSGADAFDYTHPRTGEAVTARFKEPPQWAEMEGVLYNVSISLEILP